MEKQVMKTILRQNKCGQTCLFRVWVLEFLRLIQSVWCLLFWLSFFFHKMSIRITHTRGRLRGDWVLRIVQGTWWIFSWGKWLLLLLVLTLIPWKCPVVFVYRTISSVVLSVNGLPRWLSGKEPTYNAGVTGDGGSTPGLGSSPEKEMAAFSILAWRIPWTEKTGRLHGVTKGPTRLKWHRRYAQWVWIFNEKGKVSVNSCPYRLEFCILWLMRLVWAL